MKRTKKLTLLMSFAAALTAVAQSQAAHAQSFALLKAKLRDAGGQEIGKATFWPSSHGKTFVHIEVWDAMPGFHGIHVHANNEKLGCVAPAFTSVGSHYVAPGDGSH